MSRSPKYHIARAQSLKSARSGLETYWQELAYYAMPRKAYINRFRSLSDRLPDDIYDSTAINSLNYMAAGIQGYLTNPQMRWFGLQLKNRRLMEIPGTRDWLRDCEDQIYDCLNGTNYYQENNECYRDLGCIGTHCLYSEEDLETDIRFYSIPIERVVLAEDAFGRITTAYIEYEFTADQAYQKFGEAAKINDDLARALVREDYTTMFKYLLCIYPRFSYNPGKKDKKNMPVGVEWIDKQKEVLIKESGFKEFPFMVSRWAKWSGDLHGASPEMDVLADIKMLNQMSRSNLISGEKSSDPPLDVPDEAFLRPMDFDAGGINYRNTGFTGERIYPIVSGNNGLPFAIQMEDSRRISIQRAFFNDLFIVLNNQSNMTAEEVRQRVAERMLLLGPAIGMLISENVQPTITRTFNVLARNGKLAEPPPGIVGEEFIVTATSPLARAQKMVELQGLQLSMGMVAQLMAIQPEVSDKIKFDEVVDFVAEITSLNPKLIRDDAEVDEIRVNRAKAQAAQQQMQMIAQGAQAVKTGTEADRNMKETQMVGAGK
jgi:hypothetical protein